MEIETYKWDYMLEEKLDKLKELGRQGWEVCGSDVYALPAGPSTRFLLKRPCGKVRIVTRDVTRDQSRNDGYENER